MSLITPLRHVGPSVRPWHAAMAGGRACAPQAPPAARWHAPHALRAAGAIPRAIAVGKLPVIGAPVAVCVSLATHTNTCREGEGCQAAL
eukprot:870660-Prymnesium_polylepis.1